MPPSRSPHRVTPNEARMLSGRRNRITHSGGSGVRYLLVNSVKRRNLLKRTALPRVRHDIAGRSGDRLRRGTTLMGSRRFSAARRAQQAGDSGRVACVSAGSSGRGGLQSFAGDVLIAIAHPMLSARYCMATRSCAVARVSRGGILFELTEGRQSSGEPGYDGPRRAHRT